MPPKKDESTTVDLALLDLDRLRERIDGVLKVTEQIAEHEYSIEDLEVRLDVLEEYWAEFLKNDTFVQRYSESKKDDSYFKDNDFAASERAYITAKARYKKKLKELNQQNNAGVANSGQTLPVGQQMLRHTDLEKLKLPTFSGNQQDWETFKDKFESLVIKDVSMSQISKRQRLDNCLQGDALELLKGIRATSSNFQVAWDALCRQYDNKLLRFTSQMEALVNLPTAKEESVKHLNSLLATVAESVAVFKDLERPVDHWDDIFVFFISSKLAPTTRLSWARHIAHLPTIPRKEGEAERSVFPKLKELREYLEARIQAFVTTSQAKSQETFSGNSATSSKKSDTSSGTSGYKKKNENRQKFKSSVNVATAQTKTGAPPKRPCALCNGPHFIGYCPQFISYSQEQRRKTVDHLRLCTNCLKSNHQQAQCLHPGRCQTCGGMHHTKIHADATSTATTATSEVSVHATEIVVSPQHTGQSKLLATACVILASPEGHTVTARALLDPCAEDSFVSQYIAQVLRLPVQRADVRVSGVGGTTTINPEKRATVILKSTRDADFSLCFSALVLKKVTNQVPRTEVKLPEWPELEKLQLADANFGHPARIDCILDTEIFAAVLRDGLVVGPPGVSVSALNTVFGWVIMGGVAPPPGLGEPRDAAVHMAVRENLDTLLSRFWQIEEVPTASKLTPDEEFCYRHFRETHSRQSDGRYVVRLPFREDCKLPARTMPTVESCLVRLERRFQLHPDVFTSYKNFMTEYLELGHMEEVPQAEVFSEDVVYLPHHAVFRKDNPKKIRVVFNASQLDSSGISLNSCLLVGPKLQENVLAIIIRWAFMRYVFTCDVVKMFRQFRVHENDCDKQRIVWRDSSELELRHYRLSTVTYGTASAPFLANACMLQLAEDEKSSFPVASHILKKNRYVDDFFSGGDTLEETIQARDQLLGILSSAGMSVGKWAASDSVLLEGLNDVESGDAGALFQDEEVVSTLGLLWNSSEDAFCFKLSNNLTKFSVLNKRAIASDSAKLFDPIGWVSPVVISAKIIMQDLWRRGLEWDEPVPDEVVEAWSLFKAELKEIESIRISRWVGTAKNSEWQLHCFCDASERAYAAALYVVVRTDQGLKSRLITAKSKVAPIKVISLPRLELCGAVLLAHLAAYFLEEVEVKPSRVFCWSDSEIVLAWLQSHPSRWKVFVANRVSEILSILPGVRWGHVRSGENPADLGSRGVSPSRLKDSSLWWYGPEWLSLEETEWPGQSESCGTSEEERVSSISVHTVQESSDIDVWLTKFSSFDKYVHILALIAHWKFYVRNQSTPVNQNLVKFSLSAKELTLGRIFLWRLVQSQSFSSELLALTNKGMVSKSSSIARLSPILGNDKLIRVGGRLEHSWLSEAEKHPIIIPGRHHITEILISQAHIVTEHGGVNLVLSYLSRRYWLVKGTASARRVVRACITCARFNAKTLEQQMAPLPAVRVRPSRPFTYTGLDYAGPFMIRLSPGRGTKSYKGYVALFVCMVVRAVHIEVVSSLSTDAFLAAFRRFVARRGLCKIVYSDNGTTFTGAHNELRNLFSQASAFSHTVAAELAHDEIEWSFIPPRAPNFGGLWEANIKSFKRHLRRAIGDTLLTYEEFSTICCSIEACLNSRPLSVLTFSENDLPALTPGHFLMGTSIASPPELCDPLDLKLSLRNRWRNLRLMRDSFWYRWQREYLNKMQLRSKWLSPNRKFQVGDIVLFKDELLPATRWPLARIIELYPGSDGLSRVAKIKTANSVYKRSINKLILLPANAKAEDYYTASDSDE